MKIFSGEMREKTIRYSYDEAGRLIGKQLPGRNYTDYRYNAAGKLEEILHKGADFTEHCHYSYDVMGNKVMAEKESLKSARRLTAGDSPREPPMTKTMLLFP